MFIRATFQIFCSFISCAITEGFDFTWQTSSESIYFKFGESVSKKNLNKFFTQNEILFLLFLLSNCIIKIKLIKREGRFSHKQCLAWLLDQFWFEGFKKVKKPSLALEKIILIYIGFTDTKQKANSRFLLFKCRKCFSQSFVRKNKKELQKEMKQRVSNTKSRCQLKCKVII